MSGDLEDFLRRAAQRRQAKAAQGRDTQGRDTQGRDTQGRAAQGQSGGALPGGGRPGAKRRPEYSDRKTERIVSAHDADEVLMAEVVEDHEDSIAVRMQRIEAAKRTAAAAEAELARRKTRTSSQGETFETLGGIPFTGHPAEDLLRLLRQPGGVQQAILLKEILDRPEHRW